MKHSSLLGLFSCFSQAAKLDDDDDERGTYEGAGRPAESPLHMKSGPFSSEKPHKSGTVEKGLRNCASSLFNRPKTPFLRRDRGHSLSGRGSFAESCRGGTHHHKGEDEVGRTRLSGTRTDLPVGISPGNLHRKRSKLKEEGRRGKKRCRRGVFCSKNEPERPQLRLNRAVRRGARGQ